MKLLAPLHSRTEVSNCLRELAQLQALLGCAASEQEASIQKLLAGHQAAVAKIQEKHQPLITKLSGDISERKTALEAWAKENRPVTGTDKFEFDSGVLSFRKHPRSVDLVQGFTWPGVLKRLVAAMKVWKRYVRMKPELNKRLILEDSQPKTRDGAKSSPPKLKADKLASVGLRVVQEESFDIAVKWPGEQADEWTSHL